MPESGGSGDYKLSGIIDLGDLMDSYAVYDLAITIAYMVMSSKNMDPLAVGYHVIEGYETEASLNEAEWQALRVSWSELWHPTTSSTTYWHMLRFIWYEVKLLFSNE